MDEEDIIAEMFSETLCEYGVHEKIDTEIQGKIANDFINSFGAYNDMKCNQFRSAPNSKSNNELIEELKSKIRSMEEQSERKDKLNKAMERVLKRDYNTEFVGLTCSGNITFDRNG